MAAAPNINATTPVYLVTGHSAITSIQRRPKNKQFIKFGPGQVLIATTTCGRFNYGEKKNIYKYLKNNASIAQLRGFLSNPQLLKNKLVQNKLPSEKSTFDIFYKDSPQKFPAVNIDIETEVYDGIFPAPVNYKILRHRSTNRMGAMKNHLVNKNPSLDIPSWWNATTTDKSLIPLQYIIGEKPGIYIVSVCQSHSRLGGVTGFGTSVNPNTGKTQATVNVSKMERLTPKTRIPKKRPGPERQRTLGIGRDPVTGKPQLQPLPGTVLRNTPGSVTQGAFREYMKLRKRGRGGPPKGYINSSNSNATSKPNKKIRLRILPMLPNSFVRLTNKLGRLSQPLQTIFRNRIRSRPHSVNSMNTIVNQLTAPNAAVPSNSRTATNQSTKNTVNAARRSGLLYSQVKNRGNVEEI